MATASQQFRATTIDVRNLMIGASSAERSIVQQAYRVHPADSDEAVLVRCGGEFWVAVRLSDQVSVWACHDLAAGEDTFDSVLARGDGWVRVDGPRAAA